MITLHVHTVHMTYTVTIQTDSYTLTLCNVCANALPPMRVCPFFVSELANHQWPCVSVSVVQITAVSQRYHSGITACKNVYLSRLSRHRPVHAQRTDFSGCVCVCVCVCV
jgi:hypothetical protein